MALTTMTNREKSNASEYNKLKWCVFCQTNVRQGGHNMRCRKNGPSRRERRQGNINNLYRLDPDKYNVIYSPNLGSSLDYGKYTNIAMIEDAGYIESKVYLVTDDTYLAGCMNVLAVLVNAFDGGDKQVLVTDDNSLEALLEAVDCALNESEKVSCTSKDDDKAIKIYRCGASEDEACAGITEWEQSAIHASSNLKTTDCDAGSTGVNNIT